LDKFPISLGIEPLKLLCDKPLFQIKKKKKRKEKKRKEKLYEKKIIKNLYNKIIIFKTI